MGSSSLWCFLFSEAWGGSWTRWIRDEGDDGWGACETLEEGSAANGLNFLGGVRTKELKKNNNKKT